MTTGKSTAIDREERRQRVARLFYQFGWENADAVEAWDGHDIEALRGVLSPEEFQQLLDELQDEDPRAH